MDARLRIVVVDPAKGEAKVAYLGSDAGKAQKAFDDAAADVTNECVRLFVYPMPAKKRMPAAELAYANAHTEKSTKAINAAAEHRVNTAAAAVTSAQKNLDAAKAHHASLVEAPKTTTENEDPSNIGNDGADSTEGGNKETKAKKAKK